jgi:hypothetical protein
MGDPEFFPVIAELGHAASIDIEHFRNALQDMFNFLINPARGQIDKFC